MTPRQGTDPCTWSSDEIDELLRTHEQCDRLGRELDELRPWFFADTECEGAREVVYPGSARPLAPSK